MFLLVMWSIYTQYAGVILVAMPEWFLQRPTYLYCKLIQHNKFKHYEEQKTQTSANDVKGNGAQKQTIMLSIEGVLDIVHAIYIYI